MGPIFIEIEHMVPEGKNGITAEVHGFMDMLTFRVQRTNEITESKILKHQNAIAFQSLKKTKI